MKPFNSFTRKAILIGSPGPSNNFLNGVAHDLHNMNRFLQSDRGGAWNKSEIKTINNASLLEVQTCINAAIADYVLVYFSGHGYTDIQTNQRMLSLKDCQIADLSLLNESPKQLVIVDACRNYFSTGLSGLPVEPKVDHFDKISVHDLFNEFIALSPNGKMIVHATQSSKSSRDSSLGGCFSNAFLHVSSHLSTENQYAPCSVDTILPHAQTILAAQGINQVPTIAFRAGNLTVPFAIGIPSFNKLKRNQSEKQVPVLSSNLIGLGILTVLVVGVAIAVSK